MNTANGAARYAQAGWWFIQIKTPCPVLHVQYRNIQICTMHICRNIQKDTSSRLGHKKRARTSPFFWWRFHSNIQYHKRWKLFLLHSLSYNLKVLAYRHHFRREVYQESKDRKTTKRLRKQFQTTNKPKHTFLNIETIWIPGKQISSKKNWISPK